MKNKFFHYLLQTAFVAACFSAIGHKAMAQPSNVTMANAQAEISAEISPDGDGVLLKLHLPPGTKANTQAPWKLSLSGNLPYSAGVNPVLDASDFNTKKSLFSIPLSRKVTKKDAPEGTYDLTYFLCDKQETWCKQAKAQGDITLRGYVTDAEKRLSKSAGADPLVQPKRVSDLRQLILNPGIPAVISFGALWCKPCIKELSAFQNLTQEYRDKVQFVSVIVEGETKGQAPTLQTMQNHFTKNGIGIPKFRVLMDKNWEIFETVTALKLHSLPTIVLVAASGKITEILQQSLDEKTEMKPRIERLLSPGLSAPTSDKNALNNEAQDKIRTVSLAAWQSDTRVSKRTDLFNKLQASWKRGLSKTGFTADELPFQEGKVTLQRETEGQEVPQMQKFASASGCRMTVNLEKDGAFVSAKGICE